MDLLQLRYFMLVARMGHMTKAAQKLNITQPSLSKTIAKLEKELGGSLFDRNGRQIKLNERGHAFLEHVENMFFELDEGTRKVSEYTGSARPEEEYLWVSTGVPGFLDSLFVSFQAVYPNVIFHQHFDTMEQSIDQLNNNKVDIAVTEYNGDATFPWVKLFDEELYVIAPKNHRIAESSHIAFPDFKHENIIIFPHYYGLRGKVDEYFRQSGTQPLIIYEESDPFRILLRVKGGGGISFTSKLALWEYLQRGSDQISKIFDSIVILPISYPKCTWAVSIAISSNPCNPVMADRFFHYVLEKYPAIAEKIYAESEILRSVSGK